MKKVTLKHLLENSNLPASLVRAVVRQIGGWDNFTTYAPDITNHGIDGGFVGFTYYSDTVAFAKRNREAIATMAEQDAESFGKGVLEMIQGFRCIGNDYTQAEIARCLYGKGDDRIILNGLAWYAGESVSRAYCDLIETE